MKGVIVRTLECYARSGIRNKGADARQPVQAVILIWDSFLFGRKVNGGILVRRVLL